MFYTLGEAAKATGLTKPTLSKAIKNGRISGIKTENGSYQIDPAELHRVFPPASENRQPEGKPLQIETPEQLAETLAKEQQERERERAQQQETIADLRRRLDAEGEERRKSADEIRRLTLLLTHQPEAKPLAVAPRSLADRVWLTIAALFLGVVAVLTVAHFEGAL